MTKVHPRIEWLLKRVTGTCILDVGHARKQDVMLRGFRKRNPQAKVIGVDLDAEAVLAERDSLTLVGDALRLPFAVDRFDAVVAGELLEHVWDGWRLLRELVRVLSPHGSLYLTTPNPFAFNRWFRYCFLTAQAYTKLSVRRYLGATDHQMFWNPPSLLNFLGELGLEVVDATTIGVRIPLFARVVPSLRGLHWPWYPFTRIGSYLCVWAKAKAKE